MDILSFNSALEKSLHDFAADANLGVPDDQLKLVFCLVAAYPISFLFSYLPNNPTIKHVIGLAVGLWFGWFTLGPLVLHTAVSSLVTYILLVSFDIKKGFIHKVVFVWVMLYLSVSHIYRMYTDYLGWTLDFTGPQMLLTLKLTTLAFDYYDGTRPKDSLTPYQKHMSFQKFPSLLEYWAYVYFFGGFLAGPAFNFKEYRQYINMEMFKDAPTKGRIPSGVFPALKQLIASIILVTIVIFGGKFSLDYMRKDEFYEHDLIYRWGYIWLSTSLTRFPYYFAWTISEGACNLCGIGYSGVDANGNVKWTRAENVRIIPLELAQNLRGVTENWNIRTDKWLKHYIYERVPKAYSVGLTFLCSSVWHGFYPGYYFSFMSASFMIQAMRIIRKNIQSRFVKEDGSPKALKPVYDIITLFGTSFVLAYLMTPFKILDGYYSWKIWKSAYFVGHVLTGLAVLVAVILGSPRRSSRANVVEKTKEH